MDAKLQKIGKEPSKLILGKLVRTPKKGFAVVLELPGGVYEFVTTPVVRFLRKAGSGIYYFKTENSRYRLELCD